MGAKPRVIDKHGRARQLPNLKALRAVDPKTYPWVWTNGKRRKTKSLQANLPTHGGRRHGKRRKSPTYQRFNRAVPRIASRQPPASAPVPRLPGGQWQLGRCPAHVLNLKVDKARREASTHDLETVGLKSVSVFRAVDGAAHIKSIARAGRFCTAHLNAKGRRLVKASTALIRCKSEVRAPGVFGCTRSHMGALLKAILHRKATNANAAFDARAIFEDDLQLCFAGKAIDFITTALVRKAARAGHRLDILMLGGRDCFGSFNKNKAQCDVKAGVLSSVVYDDSTWELRPVRDILLAHAYLINVASVRPVVALLEQGFSADGALVKAGKDGLQVAGIFRDGEFTQLIKQRFKKEVGGSRITIIKSI